MMVILMMIVLSPPIVNVNNAANGLETEQQDSIELLKHVRVLERYISLKSVSVMKQTTIDK